MSRYINNPSTLKNDFVKWIFKYRYHLIGWNCFLFYEIVIIGLYSGRFSSVASYIVHYCLNISIFYIHARLVMTNGLRNYRQTIWRLPQGVVIEISLYLILLFCVQYILVEYTHLLKIKRVSFNHQFILASVFRAFYFIIFSTGYYFLDTYLSEREKRTQLEQRQLAYQLQVTDSENAYLRAQFSPHFLFNTLNFIYHDALEKAPIAAESIGILSSLLHYSVQVTSNRKYVTLEREIQQTQMLISLHQIRADYLLHIHFNYEDEIKSYRIIPLVLAGIAENIFKHGNLSSPKHPALFCIELKETSLVISSRNLPAQISAAEGLGSGLVDLKKRLRYAYKDKVTLNYSLCNDGFFELLIMLNGFTLFEENLEEMS